MKALLLKIWDFLTTGNHLFYTIAIGIIIVLFLIVRNQNNKINGLENKYQNEVKLKTALLDTVHQYKNDRNEWVAEKLTLQATVKELTSMTGQLTASQKELMERVKEIEKTNSIIAGALIETNVELKNIGNVVGQSEDSSVVFPKKNADIEFIIRANNTKAINPLVKPTLTFEKFELYNKSFVEFHWKDDKKKEGYPIAFSVSNSNQYFKTANISSYAIPGLDKEVIDPTGWQKFVKWTQGNGKSIITIGLAGAAGAGAVLLLK